MSGMVKANVSVKTSLGEPITLVRLEEAVRSLLLYAPPDAAVTFVPGRLDGEIDVVATWPEDRPRRS